MKKLASLTAALMLTGCAATVLSSGPRTVIVQAGPTSPGEGLKLAEAECAKYQRHARLAIHATDTLQWVFDCVE